MGLAKFRSDAEAAKKANEKLIEKLKRTQPKDLDEVVHKLHDEAFEEIDCMDCANCCKTISPIFLQKDIERVAKAVGLPPGKFIEKYLYMDEDGDFVLQSTPCPFLDSENYCTVYNDRPNACRGYPHTNRKRVHQVLDITMLNSLVCPAVLHITEKLRQIY
ncbi:MAG TPA: YkgJ family cysteine cluster protein [Bacteroidia bacterium]|jgi:Fe-S-cluster containining protein|nr:YkgJ family cysteine cluster protein [Bacteroidia bacterium]